MDKKMILKKWKPIIEDIFKYKNEYLVDIICIYCEAYSNKINNSNNINHWDWDSNKLQKILIELKNKLESVERLEVKKTYYNPYTGLIEYELENEIIVDEKNIIKDFDEKTFIKLFGKIGLEIIRDIDISKFRDERINEIIN
jgi:hypothetical protein